MTRVRVMTYNILLGGRRGAPLDRLVREVAPDVLLVNESPKAPVTWLRQCRGLAERWAMTYVGGGRDAGSNAVMIGPSVESRGITARKFRTPLLKPRRGSVAAQLAIAGERFGVVCCHLGLDPARRAQEVENVLELADRLRGPVVVGGDLNEPPSGPSWERLRRAGFADHGSKTWRTFPADEPVKRIDALLVRGRAQVLHHGDPGVPAPLHAQASDHRSVLAVLEI